LADLATPLYKLDGYVGILSTPYTLSISSKKHKLKQIIFFVFNLLFLLLFIFHLQRLF